MFIRGHSSCVPEAHHPSLNPMAPKRTTPRSLWCPHDGTRSKVCLCHTPNAACMHVVGQESNKVSVKCWGRETGVHTQPVGTSESSQETQRALACGASGCGSTGGGKQGAVKMHKNKRTGLEIIYANATTHWNKNVSKRDVAGYGMYRLRLPTPQVCLLHCYFGPGSLPRGSQYHIPAQMQQ